MGGSNSQKKKKWGRGGTKFKDSNETKSVIKSIINLVKLIYDGNTYPVFMNSLQYGLWITFLLELDIFLYHKSSAETE